MSPVMSRSLVVIASFFTHWRLAGGSFYEFVNEPNCMTQTPWSHPAPVVAGELGFYGALGDGGPGTLARFRLPRALALDEAGDRLFVSDSANHAVRLVKLGVANIVNTVAGVLGSAGLSGDGDKATKALLREPNGLALDMSDGRDHLYIADQGNHALRLLDIATNTLSTVAGTLGSAGDSGDGGLASSAKLSSPFGLAIDDSTRRLYISDAGNSRIRVLHLDTGKIFAAVPAAMFKLPAGMAVDVGKQVIYVADQADSVVVRIDLTNDSAKDVIITGARGKPGGEGDGGTLFNGPTGPALDARLKSPAGLALDELGQRLYIGDTADPQVRIIDLPSGTISVAATRSGYYDHKLSNDDVGPVGLAISKAQIPGFKVESVYHDPIEGGPSQIGKYFYFNPNFGYVNGSRTAEGIMRTRQYRNGVLLWVGYVFYYNGRYGVGPTRQSFPDLTNTGIRYPPPVAAEQQWENEDLVLIPSLLDQGPDANQMLYMAEGNNFVVRKVDIAAPVPNICGDPAVTGIPTELWDLVPKAVGGNWEPPPTFPR
eukprot:TRINITY_DN79403_c0_g1_i1.p1 TRINITY_DN79403_c0_g1~~TRINITY_DN79403_c0_g1_i1.p1  ORF type:complete len:542 (+),score=83.29 TRINITY_DN79403_c0_g1_i1:125-1750(+)